jgi:hypothetical protein
MELSDHEIQSVLKRFPPFEGSYETILHMNLPTHEKYNIMMAIPFGKKYYMWFTYHLDKNVCLLMELNRDKKIIKITVKDCIVSVAFALGTLLYVSSTHDNERYYIENIYYYKGLPVHSLVYGHKLGYIREILTQNHPSLLLYLPEMWWITEPIPSIPYSVHHYQFRCLNVHSPFLNQSNETETTIKKEEASQPPPQETIYKLNFKKPQYKMTTIFIVKADIQYDIYHLYACGKKMNNEYCGVACIPTMASSFFMNGLFRKIRENRNLDYVEESEDEEDFEDIREDKYVNLTKKILMECVFHPKFKKWIPVCVAPSKHSRIVHIHKL